MLLKNIKFWWQVAKPNKGLFVWQIIFAVLAGLAFTSVTIPSARIISCISIVDYSGAITNAGVVLVLVFLYCVFASIHKKLNLRQEKIILKACENKAIYNIINSTDTNEFSFAKHKILNIATKNIHSLTAFSAELSTSVGNTSELLFVLILLFSANVTLGLIVVAISVFCLILYNIAAFFEEKMTSRLGSFSDEKALILGDIIEGRHIAFDLNLESELVETFNLKSELIAKQSRKVGYFSSLRSLWVYFIWNVCVFLATVYMIKLLRLDFLTLTLFLLCLPYLNKSLDKTMDCYSLLLSLRHAKASAARVKLLLSLKEKDLIRLGTNTSNDLKGDLVFTNVSYAKGSVNLLWHLSFGIKRQDIASFVFENPQAKVAFCELLRRTIAPTVGTITIDNINIYDFSKQTYAHNFSSIPKIPFFFANTIYENLKLARQGKKQIYSVLKQLKIYEQIAELPQGINTNIDQIKDDFFLLYELSLARAMLTGAEIILFIDFPTHLSPAELKKLNLNLSLISKTRTVILATDFKVDAPATIEFFVKQNGNAIKTSPKKITSIKQK